MHAAGLIRGDVVFAVLQNGSPVAFWPARVAQDRFVTALLALAMSDRVQSDYTAKRS